GIQFVKNDDILRMTATDGHRLAIIKRKFEEPTQDFELIIPKKTCKEILNLIEEADDSVLFCCSENKVVFQFGRTQLSNLIEGKYPDMEKAIPVIEDNLLSFNRKAMLGAIRRVSIFSDSVSYGIRFDLDKDRVTISSNDPELGEAKEELEVGFNSRYIQEVLTIIKCEDVMMKLTDPSSSVLLLDPEDKEFLCLIMPMRI
ncbi:DNA polymerase III subunit beta, partial [candidate division CSSED10-310 bacterium]